MSRIPPSARRFVRAGYIGVEDQFSPEELYGMHTRTAEMEAIKAQRAIDLFKELNTSTIAKEITLE